MKRNILALVAAFATASMFVAAQGQGQSPSPNPAPATSPASQGSAMTPSPNAPNTSDKNSIVTGCLIQGSSPTVFILDNAKADPQDKTEQAKSYMLVASSGSVDFKSQLNHEVMVSGAAEDKAAPSTSASGSKLDEKALPKLTARTVSRMSDTCTTAAS